MNINQALNQYALANSARNAGDALGAARLFLSAQRIAMKCRARARREVIDYGHAGAIHQANKVLEFETCHAARSEAGRVIAESSWLYINQPC